MNRTTFSGSRFLCLGLVSSLLLVFSASAQAASCEASVEGNDQMEYNVKEIVIGKTCKQFTVHFKNVGTMPKGTMGHDWVLSKTADMRSIATKGLRANPNDPRIIAISRLLGPGEEDTVSFETAKLTAGTPYSFFCSFRSHYMTMNGTIRFE